MGFSVFKRLAVALVLTGSLASETAAQSAVYACGHIRRERDTAIDILRNSGYKTVILFNLNVEDDGSLTTDFTWDSQTAAPAGGIVCRDGEYVFDQWQPHWIDDVNALVTQPTTIERLEICIGGWGNGSYGHIANFINKYGTGPETALYRNFKSLKEAVPCIIAVNNDQEQDYNLDVAIEFHAMLAEIGFKTTLAPYTNQAYWRNLCKALNTWPGTVDRIYLQTYGGGSGNDPSGWQVFDDVPMYAGYDAEASPNLNAMVRKFRKYSEQGIVCGGFIWNYNSENIDQAKWAGQINRIFDSSGSGEVKTGNNRGMEVSLDNGVMHVTGAEGSSLRLYDARGVLVRSMSPAAGGRATVDISSLSAGLCILTDGVSSVKVAIM